MNFILVSGNTVIRRTLDVGNISWGSVTWKYFAPGQEVHSFAHKYHKTGLVNSLNPESVEICFS